MEQIIKLPSFCVIGKLGSSKQGGDIVSELMKQAEEHFGEIAASALYSKDGSPKRIWGLMSDFSMSFKPWEKGFSEGLYLYGPECKMDQEAPKGWVKWIVPEREYMLRETTKEKYQETFMGMANYFIPVEGYALSGAACDCYDPRSKKNYIYFPVKKDPILPSKEDLTSKIAPCGLHCGYCFFKACKGCLSSCNSCSYGAFQPDHVCPNVKCSQGKGLEGCYECKELESCEKGFYANKPGNAKASAIFIKRHGKKAFEEATKALLGKQKPYYSLMIEQGDEWKQVEYLEKALEDKPIK